VIKPAELDQVETVLALCERFHALPSQVLAEDASILRLVKVHDLAHPREETDDGY
jgi:hypothetical protein